MFFKARLDFNIYLNRTVTLKIKVLGTITNRVVLKKGNLVVYFKHNRIMICQSDNIAVAYSPVFSDQAAYVASYIECSERRVF